MNRETIKALESHGYRYAGMKITALDGENDGRAFLCFVKDGNDVVWFTEDDPNEYHQIFEQSGKRMPRECMKLNRSEI